MVLLYSQISHIGIKRYRIADVFSNGIFIHLEVMLSAFGLPYVNDFQTVPLNDDLGFQRMALFFPE
jgi:hypothetical protein